MEERDRTAEVDEQGTDELKDTGTDDASTGDTAVEVDVDVDSSGTTDPDGTDNA